MRSECWGKANHLEDDSQFRDCLCASFEAIDRHLQACAISLCFTNQDSGFKFFGSKLDGRDGDGLRFDSPLKKAKGCAQLAKKGVRFLCNPLFIARNLSGEILSGDFDWLRHRKGRRMRIERKKSGK